MTFELVVLGSSGTHGGPGRMCSGYLLRTDTTRVMVDCGNGSLSNLQRHVAIADVDALVITHRHPDHCVDLIGMYYALRFAEDGPLGIDVHAPPRTREFLEQLVPESVDSFRQVCRFSDAEPGGAVVIGDISLTFHDSPHAVATVALRAQHGDVIIAYSSDSGGGSEVREAARDADIFLCEATWAGDPSDYPSDLHLTGSGAGTLGREANVRRLALTHIAPYTDRKRLQREAEEAYGGPVTLVDDGDVLDAEAVR